MKKNISEALIAYLKSEFDFLVSEFGFSLSETYTNFDEKLANNSYVIAYLSQSFNKQFELSLQTNSDNFELLVRRVFDGGVTKCDGVGINCLLITDLLLLLDPPIYDFSTFALDDSSKKNIINSEAKFLYELKSQICKPDWFDTELIRHLYLQRLKEKTSIDASSYYTEERVESKIKGKLSFLFEAGYHLATDSHELPLYAVRFWFIKYSDGVNEILISRDSFDNWNYYVRFNGKDYRLPYKNALSEDIPNQIAYLIKELI
jgi:hypothetical protein